MKVDVASPGGRAAAYWFSDGLPDLLLGITLLITATACLPWLSHLSARAAGVIFFFIASAAFLLHFAFERRVLESLKARLTYPRTGYVQPPEEAERGAGLVSLSLSEPPRRQNITSFRARVVMICWAFLYIGSNAQDNPAWLPPVLTTALAAVIYLASRNSERPYSWWSAVILALSGLLFVLLSLPVQIRPSLLLMFAGLWLAAQGGCTLADYLHTNPPRKDESR